MTNSTNNTNTTKARIPVYLLTGFLGSGKTTVLNHLVKQPELARTLIIINEFGAVSLDHLLVSHANEDIVVELGSGCLCCTIRGDLAKTLRDAVWRFARQGIRQFDRVIIETTGLADPAPVLHTLFTDRNLFLQYRLQGVVTTIDAVNGSGTLDRHPEAQKQAGLADLLLLTKTDLSQAKPSAVQALQQRLQQMNPQARLIAVHDGALSAAELLALDHIEPEFSSTPMDKWLNIHAFTAQKLSTAPGMNRLALREMTMDAAEVAEVDLNRHDDHIQAHCFTFETPFSAGRFEGWLQLIMQLMGHQLLRVKGIIHLKDHPGPMVIHGVQHIFHPAAFLPAWPDADRHSKLVFITYDIERSTLARTFELFLLEGSTSADDSGQPYTEIAADL